MRKHINDEGNTMNCQAEPGNCDFSRNGDHLEAGASDEEIIAFHRQAEKVAEKAAGQKSAVGSGAKKKAKTKTPRQEETEKRAERTIALDELEDKRFEEKARAARQDYLNEGNSLAPTDKENAFFDQKYYPAMDAGTTPVEGYMGGAGFVGSNTSGHYRQPKEIASEMREDLKRGKKDGSIPKDARIGIRSTSASMTSSIDLRVENLDEQDVYQYAHAKPRRYSISNRDLSQPALSLDAIRNEPGSVFDNVKNVHDSYNYSNSNSQFDYFDRGFYGKVEVSSKFEHRQKQLEREKEKEAKAASEYGYGSQEWQDASLKRIAAEDNLKEEAQNRADRVAAYRKRHIQEMTRPGSPERTQGEYRLAMASDGVFSEANEHLRPTIGNRYSTNPRFDEIAFNHKPFGPEGMDKVEEAPSDRPVTYGDPFGSGEEVKVSFLEAGRVAVRKGDNKQEVAQSPKEAAWMVKAHYSDWKEKGANRRPPRTFD